MEIGSYTNSIDFSILEAECFTPTIFHKEYQSVGCGAAALSCITGISPITIKKQYKFERHWPDEEMVNFLLKRRYIVVPVTQCSVTNSSTVEAPITENHILLTSQLFIKNEASWCIIYRSYIFHNFEISRLTPLEFINNPLLTCYVVWHKKFARR